MGKTVLEPSILTMGLALTDSAAKNAPRSAAVMSALMFSECNIDILQMKNTG
jgi:hypothetical protein